MTEPTHLLLVEDLATDAYLIEHELNKAGIEFISCRVDHSEAFVQALTDFQPDLVLSDYSLPRFNGLEALRQLKKREPSVPFILVTGSLTEELAVECMKEGAHDYILKTSLTRLPSAVLNALEKKRTTAEKSRAEKALHRSEELYRLITENTRDLICMLDAEGRFEYVSPSFKDVLAYSTDELLGQSCFALVHPEDQQRVKKGFAISTTAGQRLEQLEFRFKHRDIGWTSFESIGNWVRNSDGLPQKIIIVSRDLTERKRAQEALLNSEERLRQAQKLEAVGQLAGGVAHDFNNILTVISGYSDLLLRRTSPDDSNRSNLEEIKQAAERATSLTRQLLAFSRKQVLQPKLFDLNALVSDMGKMLRRLISEDIELAFVFQEDEAQICADAGQMEQVLMNLVVNARDALPEGGRITIETQTVVMDDTHKELDYTGQAGTFVMLAVSDNGVGIDAETRKHIFEPFYTTKERGKGTGLGLSTVYGIVKQSGGNIWVYSEPGEGTVFKVYLPKAAQQQEAREVDSDVVVSPYCGTETILLVEDEPQIRDITSQLLSEAGYKLLIASNGADAVRILEKEPGPVHLILTDVVMPKMNGRELAERAAKLKPGIKVLYMSGYTNDAIVRHGVLDEETWFIQKPFSLDALASKTREVLDSEKQSHSNTVAITQHHRLIA